MSNRTLLLDEARGIYIPQKFAENFDLTQWNLAPKGPNDTTLEQIESDLSTPDNPHYWDCWEYVLTNAYYIDEHGITWTLEQDGDLFACCEPRPTGDADNSNDDENTYLHGGE
jgi:hypothetical protein